MCVHKIERKINNRIENINSKTNEKINNLERIKSISNTNANLIINNETNSNITSILRISNCIKQCKNNLDVSQNSSVVNQNNIVGVSNSIKFASQNSSVVNQNNIVVLPNNIKVKNKKKLLDRITNSGKIELNTEQKLIFKEEKKRSFKNLVKKFILINKLINRSLLPIKINFENIIVNKSLDEFKFDDELNNNNNNTFMNFSNKLKKLNETFIDNIGNVRRKKIRGHNKINIMIKYETLERALECKLVNDIKILSDEFKTELAKNKFQEKYSNLPSEINNKLDSISNSNIDELFSPKIIDDLSDFLKPEIDSQNGKIDIRNIVNDAINSVLSQKNKMITEFSNDFESIKKEFSFNLTKELFKNLSKDAAFVGEQNAIDKVDDLIKTVKDKIAEKIEEPTDKIINSLKKNFYKNIKPSDNGDDLLIRLFKNSSNNIHYKWAQDAILLLINYETFKNKDGQINLTNYTNNGVVRYGGNGSEKKQETMIDTTLGGIFSRLGLSKENLGQSKDEVLRKYFANYF